MPFTSNFQFLPLSKATDLFLSDNAKTIVYLVKGLHGM